MGATNHTPNLELPLFVDADKPTWRGDINDAMTKIDDAVTATNDSISGLDVRYAYGASYLGDDSTDNSAIFNAVPELAGAGMLTLGAGHHICDHPITVQKFSRYIGRGNRSDTTATTIEFNAATILTGRRVFTDTWSVTADGAHWVFTQPVGSHTILPGQIFITPNGYTHPQFSNVYLTAQSVTGNSITVANTTIPAAADTATGQLILPSNTVKLISVTGNQATFQTIGNHGLLVGGVMEFSHFPTLAVTAGLIDSVPSATTFTVSNDSFIGLAPQYGMIHVVLCVFLPPDGPESGEARMDTLAIECSHIDGSIAWYTNALQEFGGFNEVNISDYHRKGVWIDGQRFLSSTVSPLNFTMRSVRGLASEFITAEPASTNTGEPLSECIGWDEWGGNVANGYSEILTFSVHSATTVRTRAAYRFNKCHGMRQWMHAERALDGFLIGDQVACQGFKLDTVSGNQFVTNLVHIAAGNTEISVENFNPNGSINLLLDDGNGSILIPGPGYIGAWRTDHDGFLYETTRSSKQAKVWTPATQYLPFVDRVVLPTGGIGYITNTQIVNGTFTSAADWATDRQHWTFLPGNHVEILGPGATSWSPPTGITQAFMELVGSGAGGTGGSTASGTATAQIGSGGGGAGAVTTAFLSALIPNHAYVCVVPAATVGGAGAATGGNAASIVGLDGSQTSFTGPGGTFYRATGGGRGIAGAANTATGTVNGGVMGAPGVASSSSNTPGVAGQATTGGGNGAYASSNVTIGGGASAPCVTTSGGLGGNGGTARSAPGAGAGPSSGNTATQSGGAGASTTLPGCGGGAGGPGLGAGVGGAGGNGGPGQITLRY